MITRTTAYTIDLDRPTLEDRWDAPLTYGDKGANIIQATLMRGGAGATLSNPTVMLYGVLSDGTTAFRAGTVSGNVIACELDYTFYAVPGKMDLLLQLSEGTTVINTPLRITAHVKSGQTSELVSTGEQFSLAALQAIVAACETATTSATAAAAAADSAADAANTATNNAQDAADAITGITVEAGAVDYGQPPTAMVEEDTEDGHLNVVFGIPTGATGIRGTMTYSGTAITGIRTTPTAYNTEIEAAIVGDRYKYNGTDSVNVGNEYKCTLGGNAATALWIYDGNYRGIAGAGGVNTVDGISPDGNGDVALDAVRFGVDQTVVYSDTEKAQARANMGAASVAAVEAKADGLTHTATLPTSGWSGTGPYTYTANVADVSADNTVLAGPAPASKSAYEDCGAYPSAQGAGTLTFTAESVPTSAITVNVIVLNL